MNANVMAAIFKRNFIAYFSNPTGYVFICVFVAMSSAGAFWPVEFFNSNLANLDQLNAWLPYIMLIFIPAITMSIWADERRQGTDELLLTIPATDWDVVCGKYLAAVSIFAVSLVFSLVSNLVVLFSLGSPDLGLLVSTYIGYLFVGLAMLAIGMVASFLTGNLTVGFALGALFNMPFVLVSNIDLIVPRSNLWWKLKEIGIAANFDDFGRGVVSSASIVYFLMIAVVMLYLSMVLIGRRHWLGGRDGRSLIGHYLVRTMALIGIAFAAVFCFRNHDLIRPDLTKGRLNSVSFDTIQQLQELDPKHMIHIEAFISPSVPEDYVRTRLNLISRLREIEQQADGKIKVDVFETEPFSETARRAKRAHGIERHRVQTKVRGMSAEKEIFLGVAIKSGLDKVVVPFFGLGLSVEYELVRSILTVVQPERKKLGIVKTDAALFGGFSMRGQAPDQLIIAELKKQFEVVEVDPNEKIVDPENPTQEEYDVLMVVQPSSLTPAQLPNLLDAIRAGVPTAVFEDPFPARLAGAPGTSQPRQPPQHMGMMRRPPPSPPKCKIEDLWRLLGVKMVSESPTEASVIWQAYNPYPKLRQGTGISNEWIFANPDAPGGEETFNPDSEITRGFKEILFLAPGAISQVGSKFDFTKLATTGTKTGTVKYATLERHYRNPDPFRLGGEEKATGEKYTIAARVEGKLEADQSGEEEKESKHTPGEIDVVIVMDIDLMESMFLHLRAEKIPDLNLNFQNVPFVLNVLDSLAGDTRFLNIRTRQMGFQSLSKVEQKLNRANDEREEAIKEFRKDFKKKEEQAVEAREEAVQKFQKTLDEMRKQKDVDFGKIKSAEYKVTLTTAREMKLEHDKKELLKSELSDEIQRIDDDLEVKTREIQDRYKVLAVFLPPIPPLLLALIVFFMRLSKEKEGISAARLRSPSASR